MDRPSRSATACRGSRAHCYPFRCRSRGCGEAEQRRGGRTTGGREGRREGGREEREGRGRAGGTAGGGREERIREATAATQAARLPARFSALRAGSRNPTRR